MSQETPEEPLGPARIRRPAPGVKLVKNVMIPMADGIRLAADVYLPDDGSAALSVERALPVVIDYLPYRKDEVNPAAARLYLELPRRGYIAARVDIRGTGGSEGVNTDEYTRQEQADGVETVEWVAAQPWCDGHVNVMGISYGGFTALQVAAQRPPHLTSIIPVDFTDDRYTDDCHYRGGLLRMYYDIGWYGTRMIAWGAMPPDSVWAADDWAVVWERHIADNEP
ncbi:MAG: CocE/NonD family hydrolase, partial [Acidimicrobiales bacterium]